ncbi:uncharacterized protein LOC114867935 isoform X2 [Betta splendens]|uniref:Uncharacterized protein LOC114867935 isoform X2 n=1 Tax=Betta splendens TaxID=158456 RepID=A0A9W2Y7M8_BETSP|nr:uncharacterized protein LOC114867935 isoform X2 [Betta splendens]
MTQCHDSPGHRCCWRKTFRPCTEICCGGRRHERVPCCGLCPYNAEHPHVKCCSGTLYNVTSLGTNAQDARLLSEGGVITADHRFYFPKTRFGCCCRRYYNPAVCSCCAGIHPINHTEHHQHNIQGFRFLSVKSLNKDELCGGIHIGTVKNVSLHGVEFTNVLKIHGSNGTVTLGSLSHTVPIPDLCSSSVLTLGSAHFFNEANVFVDPNHCSVLRSLHFIFSSCSYQ